MWEIQYGKTTYRWSSQRSQLSLSFSCPDQAIATWVRKSFGRGSPNHSHLSHLQLFKSSSQTLWSRDVPTVPCLNTWLAVFMCIIKWGFFHATSPALIWSRQIHGCQPWKPQQDPFLFICTDSAFIQVFILLYWNLCHSLTTTLPVTSFTPSNSVSLPPSLFSRKQTKSY